MDNIAGVHANASAYVLARVFSSRTSLTHVRPLGGVTISTRQMHAIHINNHTVRSNTECTILLEYMLLRLRMKDHGNTDDATSDDVAVYIDDDARVDIFPARIHSDAIMRA